jgi:hypothetical protein
MTTIHNIVYLISCVYVHGFATLSDADLKKAQPFFLVQYRTTKTSSGNL